MTATSHSTTVFQLVLGVATIFPWQLLGQHPSARTGATDFVAGFRASRILGSYPDRIFPSAEYWLSTGEQMAQKFPGASPGGVWIVSLYQNDGVTRLNFPSDGNTYPFITFGSIEQNESYLTRFDSAGFHIWLQVEPGAASIDTLITLVLNRYKHHPCVKGFGIDVESFHTNTNAGGRAVTDAEALAWETAVKAVDSNYTLFLKHYAQNRMPPLYRGEILFVDDSQGFPSLTSMVNEFKSWGTKFSPNPVAFQFGYKADTTWWKQYADPPQTLGNALISAIPNCKGLFWVDFTIMSVFPPTFVEEGPYAIPYTAELSQNYPNPFNAQTEIRYQIAVDSRQMSVDRHVRLSVYDVLGRGVAVLVNEEQWQGTHSARWNAGQMPSGVYVYRLETGGAVMSKRMLLVK